MGILPHRSPLHVVIGIMLDKVSDSMRGLFKGGREREQDCEKLVILKRINSQSLEDTQVGYIS